MLVTGAAEQPRLERDRRGPAAEAFLNPELKLRVLAAIIDLQATKQRRDEWSEEMHSMKVLSIAAAAGLTGALLSIGPADAHPINAWDGVQGARNGAWHAWRRNPWGIYRSLGIHSPLGVYGYPYGDYLPYAGRDCFGSIRFRNAFCY